MTTPTVKGNPYYLNNPNLPTIHAEFEWTPEMLSDLKKCEKDIIFFAEKYFYIVNLDRGKEIIKLYKYQKRILKNLQKFNKLITLASRQSGKTTMMTIYALWLTCFNADKKVLIVANKEKTAKEVLDRVRVSYEFLPNWLKPAVEDYSKTYVKFVNGSKIDISTTSSSASRGAAINCLIVDECAHIQPHLADEFFKSILPTISSSKNSKVFIISTANGTNNFFYNTYTGADKGDNGWKAERIDWWDVPGRDEKWKQDTINMMGSLDSFDQEFGNNFLKSGESAIDQTVLKELKLMCRTPKVLDTAPYKIWESPDPKKLYVIGVDVSEGVGQAYSVAQVLDITDLTDIRQVAVFRSNKIDPFFFAQQIFDMTKQWIKPLVLIERNNQGGQVLQVLSEQYNYDRLAEYQTEKGGVFEKSGLYSNNNVKYEAVINMRYWLNSLRVVKLVDKDTVNELETFERQENGTWKKRNGEDIFDDSVLALVWALFALNYKITQKYFEIHEYDDTGHPLKIVRTDFVDEDGKYGSVDRRKYVANEELPFFMNNIDLSNSRDFMGFDDEVNNPYNKGIF